MRKIAVLSLFIGLLILSSCGHKDGKGSLTLKFNPMFGSSTLRLNRTYQATDGKYYNFSKLRLFLSHIKLVRTDASTVELKPLVYISMSDSTTLSIPLGDSVGSFTGIQFSVGMDSVQNNTDPASYSDPNMVEAINDFMYWDASRKFVYIQLEGVADTVPNPTASSGVSYHVGTDPFYRTVSLSKTFSTSASGATTLTLNTDIQKIFTGANGINIFVNPSTQTTDYPGVAQTFMSNLSQSFSLQ